MKENRYVRQLAVAIVLFLSVFSLFIGVWSFLRRPRPLNSDSIDYELSTVKKIYFDEMGLENFTCTGLTYDYNEDVFWVADYGALPGEDIISPRLVKFNSELTEYLAIFDIGQSIGVSPNVQGIAYDGINNTLRIATGESIVEVDKEGNLVSSIDLNEFKSNASNGICFDADGNLWCLCYTDYLLKYSHDGELLDKYLMNFENQDHLFYYNEKLLVSIGADYNGENNYIIAFTSDEIEDYFLYRIYDSYAVEGICIKDSLLYVVNDGYFHDAKIKRSYISVYDAKAFSDF